MVSVKKLERMLGPYSIDFGFSSEYTRFDVYKRDGISVRVDELDIYPWGKIPTYQQALLSAAQELGLISRKKRSKSRL